jgi:coatomer subunit beta'
MIAAEDGAIRFWHSQTYKLESNLNYNMDRIWSIDLSKDSSNLIAFGFDDGTVVVKIGSDEPVVSMKYNSILMLSSGKVVFAKNMEFFTINLKAININDEPPKDGAVVAANQKELGMSDIYPIVSTQIQ